MQVSKYYNIQYGHICFYYASITNITFQILRIKSAVRCYSTSVFNVIWPAELAWVQYFFMLELYSFVVPLGRGGDNCINHKSLAYKQQPQVAALHFLLEISS